MFASKPERVAIAALALALVMGLSLLGAHFGERVERLSRLIDAAQATAAEAAPEALSARLDQVTVRVLPGQGHGSGVVIGDGTLVLTARHVVEGVKDGLKVETKDGTQLDAKVLWIGSQSDVALLRIEGGRLPAAELRCEPTRTGEPIEVVGHPLSFPWTHTWGRVSHPAQDVKGTIYLQTDANAYFGNSGGPAFDRDGRVVGLLVAIAAIGSPYGMPSPIGISWIVPATQVCELLAGGVVVHEE